MVNNGDARESSYRSSSRSVEVVAGDLEVRPV
jgi:hypothetical protein